MIIIEGEAGAQRVDFSPDRFSDAVAAALASLPPDLVVGIIADTGVPLLKAWHACIGAGRVPVILQKPTQKLSRLYWSREVAQAMRDLGVGALLCQNRDHDPEVGVPTVLLDALPAPTRDGGVQDRLSIASDARLLQLSSGTTGHRKGIGFDFGAVARHAADYNRVLGLGAQDCIVSWLPLYHDMGFIAAFLMSQIIGARLVLIDPMRWVRQPELLFDLIERHGGTVCLMPNFGFEVMTQRGRPRRLPSMRRWISCSEPTRPATIERFLAATATPGERFANCYGMAENIFAVAQSDGMRTAEIDGRNVVSCGRPIPGTQVKLVDGELFIRSPCSLQAYVGGGPIVDAEGFYASGDLGALLDGEIYLTGRRHDVVIHAGQKFLLSDIDHKLDGAQRAGRVASFGIADPALGTETIVGLIEHPDFWVANRDVAARAAIARETGAETAQIHHVPPRFITKTSSGKVNRARTAVHWTRNLAERVDLMGARSPVPRERLLHDVRDLFPGLDFGRPIGAQIDSLGIVNLSLLLSRDDPEFRLDLERSIDSYCSPSTSQSAASQALKPVIKIVALCDWEILGRLLPATFEAIALQYRVPVQIRHLVAPPARLLLSDLIFSEYFLSRDDRFASADARRAAYQPVLNVHRLLRDASVILVDEMTELVMPHNGQSFPVINHDFQAGPGSDRLTVRWARYSQNHHLIASDVVDGCDLDPAETNRSLLRLEDYLGIPVVKIAFTHRHTDVTANWDVLCRCELSATGSQHAYESPAARRMFVEQLLGPLNRAVERAPLQTGVPKSFIHLPEQSHWCGERVNPALLDFILDRYDKLLVLGYPSSASYLQREAARRGKRVVHRTDLRVDGDHDCIVQAGVWGRPETDKPVFVLITGGWGEPGQAVYNVSDAVRAACPPARI